MLHQTDHEQIVEQYSFYQHQNHLREQAVFSDISRLVMVSFKVKQENTKVWQTQLWLIPTESHVFSITC